MAARTGNGRHSRPGGAVRGRVAGASGRFSGNVTLGKSTLPSRALHRPECAVVRSMTKPSVGVQPSGPASKPLLKMRLPFCGGISDAATSSWIPGSNVTSSTKSVPVPANMMKIAQRGSVSLASPARMKGRHSFFTRACRFR